MAIWIDEKGLLHDDMDGAALNMSSWPKGLRQATDAEIARVQNPPKTVEQLRAEVVLQLDEVDAQSVRPLRAKVAGTATDADVQKLAELDKKAADLRAKLASI